MNYFWDNVKSKMINDIGREYGWIRRLASIIDIDEITLSQKIRRDSLPNVNDAVRIAQVLNTTVEALVLTPPEASQDKDKDTTECPDSYTQTNDDPA